MGDGSASVFVNPGELVAAKSIYGGVLRRGLDTGGTGDAGFVLKSGKVGCVSYVCIRYSISLGTAWKCCRIGVRGLPKNVHRKHGIFFFRKASLGRLHKESV